MLILIAAAFAGDPLPQEADPFVDWSEVPVDGERIVPLDHAYVGGLVDQRGRCEDPEALREVLRRLAAEEARSLQDFEVGDPALPDKALTMDLQSADVRQVFRLLSDVGDTNIVLADGVDGEVTLHLLDTPWDQVFEVVLVSAQLDAKVGDNVIVVYPL